MPSSLHRSLLALTTFCAALAILICALPITLQICGCLALCLLFRYHWHALGRQYILHHHSGPDDTINQWTIESPGRTPVSGQLQRVGYRSAGLLVLVFRDQYDRSHRLRIPVWRDSVSALQFSYLNLQLMFNTREQKP